jgi:hypothetical protein
MCREATRLVQDTEEKKLLLAALASVKTMESLTLIVPHLDDPATKEEAGIAVTTIAEQLLKGNQAAGAAPSLIAPLEKVAQVTANANQAKRAKSLLQQAQAKAGGN